MNATAISFGASVKKSRFFQPQRWWLSLLLVLTYPPVAYGQLPARTSNVSLGLALNQFQNDFGMGVVMTTPYFANNRMSVRLSANVGFFNGVPERKSTVERMPYQAYKAGIVGVGGHIRESIRLYFEGGTIIIVPNKDFSDDNVLGEYGVFGFEFFLHESGGTSYFIELGGVRTVARAEKIATKPFYSNGFTISAGFKHYF